SANVEIGAVNTTTGLTLTGNAGDNTLFGNNGDDVLIGGGGNDAMSGGDGDDTYVVDSLGDAVVENVGEGTDKVIATVNNVTLASNVEIGAVGLATGLTLTGNAGDNILFGASGNDVLNGGAGNDAFAAGAGNDIINGGVGNDAMSGGAGDDTFVFTLGDGFDQVTDFTAGDSSGDLIALTGYGVASFAQLQAFMSQDGSDVKIAFDSNNQITLQGVTLGQLNQNDFQLA
ncbi:MAG: calcium-binding protein, partial [Rhodoplanes sp.]